MKILTPYLLLSVLFLTTSCGESEKKKEKDGFQYEQSSESAEKSETAVNEVLITGNDMMKYNVTEIRVKAGEPVTLTLKHIGKLDVKVMGHNWVLLKQGTDLIGFASKASAAAASDYIPEDDEDIIAHTSMLGGGESDTITFEAPEPGTYEFLCSFPGHFGQMRGKFIVE